VVIAIPVAIAILAFAGGGSDDDLVASLEESRSNLPLDMANGTKLGRDDAPVKLTVFEDFQCPFCLAYTGEQEGAIVEELVKTGEMQIEYRHLPILGPESVRAATASQCAADQNKFWQYHHELFLLQARADQVNDEKTNVGRFSDDKLKQMARDLEMDGAVFDTCFDNNTHLEKVTNDQREANQFGINGTPGFLVNGQALGQGTPVGIENWKKLVEDVKNAIATATANASATPSTTTTAAASPTAAGTTAPTATRTP
jgi:protein-disulfide isomerase